MKSPQSIISENNGQNKIIEETIKGETGEVELYRSYGVRKKVNPLLIFINVAMAKVLFVMLMVFEIIVISTGAIFLFLYGGVLISTLLTSITLIVVFNKTTKIPRRRISFQRKLKKACKKEGCTLNFHKEFFKSLRWSNEDELDLTVKAGKYTYFVKYITPKKPLSSVTFLSRYDIKYTKHARKNVFTLMLGFKDKTKMLKINFPHTINACDKYQKKIIIVNPNPRDILVKNPEGAVVPTGSGEQIYGYTIYTGTGFIDEIKRKAREAREEK